MRNDEGQAITANPVRVGTPHELFEFEMTPSLLDRTYAIGPDGDTFFLLRPVEPIPGIVVVHNWLSAAR